MSNVQPAIAPELTDTSTFTPAGSSLRDETLCQLQKFPYRNRDKTLPASLFLRITAILQMDPRRGPVVARDPNHVEHFQRSGEAGQSQRTRNKLLGNPIIESVGSSASSTLILSPQFQAQQTLDGTSPRTNVQPPTPNTN